MGQRFCGQVHVEAIHSCECLASSSSIPYTRLLLSSNNRTRGTVTLMPSFAAILESLDSTRRRGRVRRGRCQCPWPPALFRLMLLAAADHAIRPNETQLQTQLTAWIYSRDRISTSQAAQDLRKVLLCSTSAHPVSIREACKPRLPPPFPARPPVCLGSHRPGNGSRQSPIGAVPSPYSLAAFKPRSLPPRCNGDGSQSRLPLLNR